jgi:hypothetical protein
LPVPPFETIEYEAWKASGYTGLSHWQHETDLSQAKVIAHHIHMKLREAYEAQEMMKKSKSKDKGTGAHGAEDYHAMIAQRFGVPPPPP